MVRYYKRTEKGERKVNKYFEKAYREIEKQSEAKIVSKILNAGAMTADKIAEVLGMSAAEVQALAKKVQA